MADEIVFESGVWVDLYMDKNGIEHSVMRLQTGWLYRMGTTRTSGDGGIAMTCNNIDDPEGQLRESFKKYVREKEDKKKE